MKKKFRALCLLYYFFETSDGPGKRSISTNMLEICHIKKNIIMDAILKIAFVFNKFID